MQKAASAYKTISGVSEALGIPAHVLRFWESKFTQLKPMKRSGGRRYYRQEDIALLETIKSLLYDEGYTIKGAQASLSKRRKADAMANLATPSADIAAPPSASGASGSGSGAAQHSFAPRPEDIGADTIRPEDIRIAVSLLAEAQSRIDNLLARI